MQPSTFNCKRSLIQYILGNLSWFLFSRTSKFFYCVNFSDKVKSLNKTESALKKVTKDRDELESAIDKLRDELSKTEVTKKELKHQVTLVLADNRD